MNLKERKKQILKIIINNYIDNGTPIGSKAVVDNLDQKLSTATIRNEMAALEEMGFLIQPHVSSGRVPSDLAYRFYVDVLMDNENLSEVEIDFIQNIFNNEFDNVHHVITDAVKVLSDITNCVAIAVLPSAENISIQNLKLVKLTDDKALVVIVTSHGIVKDRVIKIDTSISQQNLDSIANHISKLVVNEKDIENIEKDKYTKEIEIGQGMFNQVLDLVKSALNPTDQNKLIIDGKNKVFDFPEYRDIDKAKMIMQSFDDQNMLKDVLAKSTVGANVVIGAESKVEAIEGCSVVTINYDLGNNEIGSFALVGPKRMNYSKMLKILQIMSENLEYYKHK